MCRLNILVQKAESVHFFDNLYHLGKYLKEAQLFDEVFHFEVLIDGVLCVFLNEDVRAIR